MAYDYVKLKSELVDRTVEFRRAWTERKGAKDLLEVAHALRQAKDALVTALAVVPEDEFMLSGNTKQGWLVTLNRSSKTDGSWQITRFDANGEPWGDSQHDLKEKAILDFISEIDVSSIDDYANRFSAQVSNATVLDGSLEHGLVQRTPVDRGLTAIERTIARSVDSIRPSASAQNRDMYPLGIDFGELLTGTTEPIVPARLYHGTNATDFSEFDSGDFGTWFAEEESLARKYTERDTEDEGIPRVYEVAVSISNTFRIPRDVDLSHDGRLEVILPRLNETNGQNLSADDIGLPGDLEATNYELLSMNDAFISKVRELGYDSIHAYEDGCATWNVLNIKAIEILRVAPLEDTVGYGEDSQSKSRKTSGTAAI